MSNVKNPGTTNSDGKISIVFIGILTLLKNRSLRISASLFGYSRADLDQLKIVNSQGKNFKYLPKPGNILENQNKIGKFRIFHKVYLSFESASAFISFRTYNLSTV